MEIERIKTSQAITDLISYIRKEELYDPMINPPKDNPFQPGFKICKILWIDLKKSSVKNWLNSSNNSFKSKYFTKIWTCIWFIFLEWCFFFENKTYLNETLVLLEIFILKQSLYFVKLYYVDVMFLVSIKFVCRCPFPFYKKFTNSYYVFITYSLPLKYLRKNYICKIIILKIQSLQYTKCGRHKNCKCVV